MSTTIYYFSGTGNSFKVAKDLKDQLEDSKLVQISKKNLSITSDTTSEKIGFVYPVFFGGLPKMVRNFIKNLQVDKSTYFFAVATLGGKDLVSFTQIDDILKKKGTCLSAGFKIMMPGNYQIMYPPFSDEEQVKLFEDETKEISNTAASIKRNETNKSYLLSGIKKAAGVLVHKALFPPYNRDKYFWTTEKCNGCGLCSRVCPADNIDITDGKPQWKHQCERCLACMHWCPQKSIQYKKKTLDRGRYHHPEIKVSELFQK